MGNESVEDLLKSLRATVQKRNSGSASADDVLELYDPISKAIVTRADDDSISGFLNIAVEKAVVKYLSESDVVARIVEKYLVSERFESVLENKCMKYFEKNNKFETLVKDVIEQKISKMVR